MDAWQREYEANVHVRPFTSLAAAPGDRWGEEWGVLGGDGVTDDDAFAAYFEAMEELRGGGEVMS